MYKSVLDEMLNLERNLNGFFRDFEINKRRTGYPVINAYETDDELKLIAVLPGVEPNNVEIVYDKGTLKISGHKKNDRDEKMNYIREERNFGEFSKTLTIGQNISVDSLNATYKNGLLFITMKKEGKPKPKIITIQ